MAEDMARQTTKPVADCFTLLDSTFGTFAKLFAMIDLGLADLDMIDLASQWRPTWEEHEHLFRKSIPIMEQLTKDVPQDQLRQRRVISSPLQHTVLKDPCAIQTLKQACSSSSTFLRKWFTLRANAASIGSPVVTTAEHRRLVSLLQHDSTYCQTTSLRALIEARKLTPPPELLHHPLLDKLLIEEELHIASRFNGPTFLDDLTSYLCELLVQPLNLDALADLEYNPDFFQWWLLNPPTPSIPLST